MTNNIFTILPYKEKLLKLSSPKTARAIYKNKIIDLITNTEFRFDWKEWFKEFDFSINKKVHKPRITHFFYELGFLIENVNSITETTLLAIDIEYEAFNFINLEKTQEIELDLIHSIDFFKYKNSFMKGRAELLAGNCYQFNLTYNHEYIWHRDYVPMDFISALWNERKKRGAFGSATFVASMDLLYLTNSPECLFQIKENILSTMPIKGTVPFKNNLKQTWQKLISNKKNESELFMIIDLMTNDLARIELPKVRVVKKKMPLIVPGLLHQYAKIEVELTKKVTVKNIIEKIFPGGSVTGAPKKRVMQILNFLEKRERGFYCGSTLLCFRDAKVASINIRSAEIDFFEKKLSYQSGGGITLKSTPLEEFNEMIAKRESFIRSL